MTTPVTVMARVEERLAIAHGEYVRARGEWAYWYARPALTTEARMCRLLREAVVARVEWSLCRSLLREPTRVEQMAHGIDADELALLAGPA